MPNNHYDIVIIGTGAGGGTLASKLAPTGKQILLLYRGGYVPREEDNWSSAIMVAFHQPGPDKGNAKWHQGINDLFLGIDHTAIVISDTDASPRFYRDALGLKIIGESENYGPEQERLTQAERELREARSAFVSTGVVQRSLVVRDPEGHAIHITQP